MILADIGVLDYASRRHPDLRLHLSVQAAASNPLSLDFYRENFGIRRAVLPRVLEVREIAPGGTYGGGGGGLRVRQPRHDDRGAHFARSGRENRLS